MKYATILALGLSLTLAASAGAQTYSGVRTPQPPKPIGSTGATSGTSSFKPYKPASTYSSRGGVNAYPQAAKPQGYISPYGKPKSGGTFGN